MISNTLDDVLKRSSLQLLGLLVGVTRDPITVQEEIEHLAFLRPTIGAVQILDYSSYQPEYMYAIKFGFSTNFMYQHRFTSLLFLPYLIWQLKIDRYEYGDDVNGGVEEEGLASWLARSKVEYCGPISSKDKFPVTDLQKALVHFEANL